MGDKTTDTSTEEQGESTEAAQGAEQQNTDTTAQGATTQDQGSGGEKPKNPAQETRLSDENAKLRIELKKLKDAEEKREREKLSEADRLKAERADFEKAQAEFAKQRQAHAAKVAVAAEASKAGFKISPERVYALVADQVQFDGDSPTNVHDVVTALATAEPGLVGAANGSPTNPDRQRGAGLTAKDIAGMSDAELAKAGISIDDMFRIAAKG